MKPDSNRLKLGNDLERQSRKSKQRMWREVSRQLLSSRKNRASVNVAEISRNSGDGARIIVPGKVLGGGAISHRVTVAAFSFSEGARAKIVASGGKCMDISDFAKDNSNAKGVLIIG
jgi:large subunit ribosomal protein L18e